jgi:hypothetical protein
MLAKPTIQLRTIFLVFFCAAIGLTCATGHPEKIEYRLAWLYNFRPPITNLYLFLLFTGSAAIVIGLLQQIRDLAQLRPPTIEPDDRARVTPYFEIGGRLLIGIILFICISGQILIARQMMQLPAQKAPSRIYPDTLAIICIIVALSNSNERWRQNAISKERGWPVAIAFVSAVVIFATVLVNTGLMTFLVHIATQGIEHAHTAKLQRAGAFPDQEREGFRLFWLSTLAAAAVVIAAVALVFANARRSKRRSVIASLAVYSCAVIFAGAFCIWFYVKEFYRISPDLASAGFASNWIDRLSGVIAAAIVISVLAYRSALLRGSRSALSHGIPCEAGQLHLHEFPLFVLLLLGVPISYFYESLRISLHDWDLRLGWQREIPKVLVEFLRWPETYIMLAVCLLSIQLLWRRSRQWDTVPNWQLQPIDVRRLALNWITWTTLAAVALPSFSIYSFTYWLGPWYLHGPK